MGGVPTHVPVLRDRVLGLLAPAVRAPGAVAVDATLGLGGHSRALLEAHPGLRLIGIDRDPDALRLAGERLADFADRVSLHRAVYDELPQVLASLGHRAAAGVLMDLGVSSLQLDQAPRGFSYSQDAPLDMRMDPTTGPTAADVLNTYPAADLARLLRSYGEERFARRIADAVVRERAREPFTTSARLVELVREAVPAAETRPPASTTEARKGSGAMVRPSSWHTMPISTGPAPTPPSSSLKGSPRTPISARRVHCFSSKPGSSPTVWRRCS